MFDPKAKDFLERKLTDLRDQLAEWKGRFDENPARAFEWAERAAEYAAELEVYEYLRACVDKRPDMTAENAEEAILEMARRAVTDLNSTSGFSNAMNVTRAKVLHRMVGPFGSVRGCFVDA